MAWTYMMNGIPKKWFWIYSKQQTSLLMNMSKTNTTVSVSTREIVGAMLTQCGPGKKCANATKNVVEYIRNNHNNFPELSDDTYFYLLQNTIVVNNAEKFYRESVASKGNLSWNSRVHHMNGTVNDLLNLYGENSGIVWAHNTHIGDAEYTSMRNTGQKNIGQLTREGLGNDNVFLIGFTTYEGKVMAGSSWGAPMKEMTIPPADFQ